MKVWLVTAMGTEEDRYGVILRATARCFGVYTTQAMAQAVADRHQGAVVELDADMDVAVQLACWENPGFYRG